MAPGTLHYGAAMARAGRPEDLLDRELPDLELPGTAGPFRLRARVGAGPQVVFFYVRNGTPG